MPGWVVALEMVVVAVVVVDDDDIGCSILHICVSIFLVMVKGLCVFSPSHELSVVGPR